MRASKSSSCKTTGALSWSKSVQIWDRGVRKGGWWRCEQHECCLLCRPVPFGGTASSFPASSMHWSDFICLTWLIKMQDCKNSWRDKLFPFHLEVSLQPTGFRNSNPSARQKEISVEVALFCLCIKRPGRALQSCQCCSPLAFHYNNNNNPATAFLSGNV